MPDSKQSNEVPRIEIVYIGREYYGNKLFHTYVNVITKKELSFSKPIKLSGVGAIFSVIPTEKGVSGPYDYIGQHKIKDDLTLWMTRDALSKREYDLTRQIKKVPKTEYDGLIERLNRIHSKLSHSQKILFKIKVFNDIK